MARYIRRGGFASVLVVDNDHEIDALMDHPGLDRDYTANGPLLNRFLLARLRRGVTESGDVLLSFRRRNDPQRKRAQQALAERLDALAKQDPWAHSATSAMASYIATGNGRKAALAALTYVTALPFLPTEAQASFDPTRFAPLYRLYRRMSLARRPWVGLPFRLLGIDRHAARQILEATGGDEYGLHAIGITLDNSVIILERLRTSYARKAGKSEATPMGWVDGRTAPALVVRQTTASCKLLNVAAELPPHTLVLLKMRRALRADSPSGFEFASAHWSACPAGHYMTEVFDAVLSRFD